jgi:hypothetical protein
LSGRSSGKLADAVSGFLELRGMAAPQIAHDFFIAILPSQMRYISFAQKF